MHPQRLNLIWTLLCVSSYVLSTSEASWVPPCNVTITPTNSLGTDLQAALDAATSPYPLTICLSAGNYTGCGFNLLRTAAGQPVHLRGAGQAATIVDCEHTFCFANFTNVDGGSLSSMTVADVPDPVAYVKLSSVLVQHVTLNNHNLAGKAFEFVSGSLTLIGCHITSSSAVDKIRMYAGFLTMINSTMDNLASTSGSPIYATGGDSIEIVSCDFWNNYGSEGGALNSYIPTSIYNSTFTNHISGQSGGIIFMQAGSTLTVSNSHFNDSTCSGSGGALYLHSVSVSVTGSSFTNCGNSAVLAGPGSWKNVNFVCCNQLDDEGGGMAVSNTDAITLDSVAFIDCRAGVYGGGLFVSDDSVVEATNVLFTECYSSWGAAVYVGGNLTCRHCEVTKNEASASGTIVFVGVAGKLEMSNSAITGNSVTVSSHGAVVVSSITTHDQVFTNCTFACGTEGASRLLAIPNTGSSSVFLDGCDFPEWGGVRGEMIFLETQGVTVTNSRFSLDTNPDSYFMNVLINYDPAIVINSTFEGRGSGENGLKLEYGNNFVQDCYFRDLDNAIEERYGDVRYDRISVYNCKGITTFGPHPMEIYDSEFIETTASAIDIDQGELFVYNSRFVNTGAADHNINSYRAETHANNSVFEGSSSSSAGSAVFADGPVDGFIELFYCTFLDGGSGPSLLDLQPTDTVVAHGLVFIGGTSSSVVALNAAAPLVSVSNITMTSTVGVCGVQVAGTLMGSATVEGVYLDEATLCSQGAVIVDTSTSTTTVVDDVTVRDSSGEFVGVKVTGTRTASVANVRFSDSPITSASVLCSGPTCNVRDVFVSGASMAGDDGVVVSANSGVLVGVNITVVDSGSTCVKVDSDANASLRDSLFSGCSAESGAGVYVDSGSASFTNCVFTDNTATVGGVGTAAGSGVSLSFSACELVGNFAPTTGAALMCYSGAACSTSDGTVVTDNSGSDAIYALFLATLDIRSTVLARNSNDAVASYGAAAVNITDSTIHGNRGGAVNSVSSPLRLEGTVIHDNSGAYAVRLYGCSDVSMISSFVSSNSGTGLSCSQPTADFVGVWNESVVCDNEVDYGCVGGCDFGGAAAAAGMCSTNSTSCGSYCASDTDYCVAAGAGFVGPYNGCPVCGGPCNTGSFSCPNSSVCTDAVGGGYDCICPTGFVGNGSQPCSDADECALGTDNCSPLANCTNTPGSFTCTCERGYTGTGITCKDIDECGDGSHDCVVNAVCTNVEGSHECECDDTSYGNGRVECRPCPANSHSFVGATNVTDCECDTNNFNIDNTVGGDCGPCPVGRYVTDAGGVLVCIECPADSYSDSPNTGGACTACPTSTTTNGGVGATSVANCSCAEGLALVVVGGTNGTAQCERYCPAGTSRPDSDSLCIDCPIGRYSDQPNQEECLPCPLNSLTAGVASTSVANCSCVSGYAAPGGAVGVDCERQCPPGSYRPAPFGLDCPVCDIGSFSDEPNVDECTPCPANAVTPAVNSTAVTDCECPPNYYTPERERGTECQPCPSGAKCKGGVSWPVARKGYIYVEDEDGTAGFAECVPFEACAGNGQCADGYTGELCERCKPNYYRLDGLCYECQNNAWLIVLACGLGLFLFCAVLVWFNSQDRAINKFASMVIGVNALQIAGMYGRLNLNWPPLAQKFFAVLSLVNFNIELVSPECAVSVNDPFVLRWLMTMGFPILVIAIFASIGGIGSLLMMCTCCGLYDPEVSKWNPRYLRHTCIRAFYQLMTIGYLPLSAAVFEFFYCVKDASGDMVISTARQTKCYTPTYWGLFPVALICSLLYPIGVPLFCGFLLKTKRTKLGMIKFSLRYGFLVGRFTEEYYFFELAIMTRKLGVALAMTFLTDNPYIKAAGAVVVLAVAFTAQLRLTPYRTRLYNGLECVCLAVSVFILMVSVTFQASAADTLTRAIVVVGLLTLLVLTILSGLVIDALAVFLAEREVENETQTVGHVDYAVDDTTAREVEFENLKSTATVMDTFQVDTATAVSTFDMTLDMGSENCIYSGVGESIVAE